MMLKTLMEVIDEEWSNITITFAEPWEISWDVPAGERDDYEIHIIEKGNGMLRIGDRKYNISRGDIIFLHSMEGNAFADEDSHARFLFLTFRFDNVKNLEKVAELSKLLRCDFQPVKLKDMQNVQEKFYQINNEICLKSDGYMFRIKLLLSELILMIAKQQENVDDNNDDKMKLNKNAHKMINKIIIFLQENYNREIRLEELGKLVNLHPRYLCTLFRQVSGKTVIELLQEIRIEKAKRLLLYTSLSITQIALEVGFGSSQYFSRIFGQIENMDPRTFRKTKKKNL